MMAISTKLIKIQLSLFKAFTQNKEIEVERKAQAALGEVMARIRKNRVVAQTVVFRDFIGEWIAPKQQKLDGVVLYLHGGGYCAGNIDYARGFSTVLTIKNKVKSFCCAYRLAPENPYPAALEDALESYTYLLRSGYTGDQIILCGESAGGGLCYALAMKLREKNMPMPAGIIAISPWVDLTASGTSYIENEERDPSLSKERLQFYASLYAEDKKDPYVSPVFGDFHGMPPSLIFVGGDEVMLSDAETLYLKLTEAGCSAKLQIKPGMWHAYILYGTRETKSDFAMILEFLKKYFPQTGKNAK